MGMYDEIYVDCPNCGNLMETQSKAGECALNRYSIDNVSETIATDLEGELIRCSKCEHRYKFRVLVISKKVLTIE